MVRQTSSDPEKITLRITAFLGSRPEFKWLVPYLNAIKLNLTENEIRIGFIHTYFADFYFKNCRLEFEKGLRQCLGNIKINYGKCILEKKTEPESSAPFTSFVCSSKNEAALSAVRELCREQTPACACLVLRGASGTGKTHLLTELARAFALLYGQSAVLKIQAARFNPLEVPEAFWRRKKVLLLDDLQDVRDDSERQKSICACLDPVLAESHRGRVAIALNGDYAHFGPKLGQRLEQSLLFDLHAADLAARIVFTEQTANRLGLNLTKTRILAIARQIQKISAITGILQKYKFYCNLDGQTISPDVLDQLALPDAKNTGWQRILMLVAEQLGRKPAEILSKSRRQEFVLARQATMFLCRAKLGLSYPELGRLFGGMDHSTVMHGIKKIQQLRTIDRDLHNLLTKLEDEIE